MDKHNIIFILTGSSARKLKRGHANLLGGRAMQRFLFPFIWTEVKDIYSLERYLNYGSLPNVVNAPDEYKKDILQAYVDIYLREEIQAEGLVRNLGGFSRFLDVAGSQFGELINYNEIARECQLAAMTVRSYYEILEDTLLGFFIRPYRKSVRKRLSAQPKVYFFDNGVTNAINKHLPAIDDRFILGRLFEQFIIQETYRLLRYKQSDAELFFWRTNHGAEVDLLITKHKKIITACEIK
jgi:predicted AAA+ superfamily ATPase